VLHIWFIALGYDTGWAGGRLLLNDRDWRDGFAQRGMGGWWYGRLSEGGEGVGEG